MVHLPNTCAEARAQESDQPLLNRLAIPGPDVCERGAVSGGQCVRHGANREVDAPR
jgi:hypothetical protein